MEQIRITFDDREKHLHAAFINKLTDKLEHITVGVRRLEMGDIVLESATESDCFFRCLKEPTVWDHWLWWSGRR
jgi:hypothetical protein